jgi:tetratricopeptide (TPR) repeat protein
MGLFSWLFGRTAPAVRDEAQGPRARAAAHLARGEYEQAEAALREALAARPDDPDLRRALAACHRALGDEASAEVEVDRGRQIARRVAEWWEQFRGRPLPLIWEGAVVGHFTPGRADDYPRVKGGWASAGSRAAGRFEGIVLRADYATRPEPLRVSLGDGVGGELLVSAVSVVLDPSGNQVGVLFDLTVITPPGLGARGG